MKDQIIIRFWKSKSGDSQYHYPHISIETPEQYFSFQPDILHTESLDSFESKSVNQKKSFPIVCKGKFLSKEEDLINGKPDKEFSIDNLDVKKIQKAIEVLKKQQNLCWEMWQSSQGVGFNCFTGGLFLLKIGGGCTLLDNGILKSSTHLSQAFFQLETPINFPAFLHFAKTVNPDNCLEVTTLKLIESLNNKPSLLLYLLLSGMVFLPCAYIAKKQISIPDAKLDKRFPGLQPKILGVLGLSGLTILSLAKLITVWKINNTKNYSRYLYLSGAGLATIGIGVTFLLFRKDSRLQRDSISNQVPRMSK